MGRDFLAPAPTVQANPVGVSEDIANAVSAQYDVLLDIRRELMKQNPEVLAVTRVQGNNTIAAADTTDKRVFFEVGGKAVTIYALWAYSTYDGNVYLSINSMSKANDGLVFAAGDQIYLPLAIDSVHILSDGANALAVNDPSNATHGGLFIYGFTIPDFDRDRTK